MFLSKFTDSLVNRGVKQRVNITECTSCEMTVHSISCSVDQAASSLITTSYLISLTCQNSPRQPASSYLNQCLVKRISCQNFTHTTASENRGNWDLREMCLCHRMRRVSNSREIRLFGNHLVFILSMNGCVKCIIVRYSTLNRSRMWL